MAYRPEWDHGQVGWRGPQGGPWTTTKTLIVSIVSVFVLTLIVQRTPWPDFMAKWFSLRVQNAWMLFPFGTYMFLHSTTGLWHLAMNCLILWFLGTDLERSLGKRRFLGLFFCAGAVGGALHLVTQIMFGKPSAPLVGASGGILALIAYLAWATPDRQVILFIVPVRMRTLFYILIAVDLFPILQSIDDNIAHFCHLGGAAYGLAFWKYQWDPFGFFARAREEIQERSALRQQQREVDDEDEMDRILAKISESGLPSLTRAEKKFLDERSKRMRDRQNR